MTGTLYLLPSPIGGTLYSSLPVEVIETARRIQHFLAENAKSARAFLKQLDHPTPLRELSIVEIGHAPREADIAHWLAPLQDGADIAIVSEAGCPAIADPGATLVAAAYRNGWMVRPLVGPSAIVLALMASGLNGQRFRFVGYLPIGAEERATAIRTLERDSSKGETQIFIETPYRNETLFAAILAACTPTTRLALAVDVMGERPFVQQRTVAEWRARPIDVSTLEKRPAVYSLLA
ncbi:MAG: SAM-dependent methyltransferase [Burkholderiaceae bacterium]|nr:SAM-dependent methyltransferase [Burkholderiaceae bacterium]